MDSSVSNVTDRYESFVGQLKAADELEQKTLLQSSVNVIARYLGQVKPLRKIVGALHLNNLPVLEKIVTQNKCTLSAADWFSYLADEGTNLQPRRPGTKLKCLFVARKYLPIIFADNSLERNQFFSDILTLIDKLGEDGLKRLPEGFIAQLELWRLIIVSEAGDVSVGQERVALNELRTAQIKSLCHILTKHQRMTTLFSIADFLSSATVISSEEYLATGDIIKIFTESYPISEWRLRGEAVDMLINFQFHKAYPLEKCIGYLPAKLQADYLLRVSEFPGLVVNDFTTIHLALRSGELSSNEGTPENIKNSRDKLADNLGR